MMANNVKRWSVPKKTNTYADVLDAIGQASLLDELRFPKVTIRDAGGEFVIESLGDAALPWPQLSPGFPYIWVRKNEEERPNMPLVVDYEKEREKREIYRKWEDSTRKAKNKAKQALDDQGLTAPDPAVPEIETAGILAAMRKGWWGDLQLAKWISENPTECLSWVKYRLGANPTESSTIPQISNSQILNPIAGKGIHATKTESRSAGSLPRQLVDPFSEWMKIRGLWRGMLLYRQGDDFKFFVLEPAEVGIAPLMRLRDEIAAMRLWGGVRLDIEATLRCAQKLIEHSEIYGEEGSIFPWMKGKTPRDFVAGLRLAYFKSLGIAAALMNDALLPLPAWFGIETVDDARAFVDIINETIGTHDGGSRTSGCLGSLEEKNSDDGAVLQQFRQWLLTGDLLEFIEFHMQFAIHLMARLTAGEWARPFLTLNLDVLLIKGFDMAFATKEIVTNSGFLSVARAVRNATIYAAMAKKKGAGGGGREIRFGLAQKWKQKIKSGKDPLIAAIAEFVQDYNWEVVNRLGKGHIVQTEDLDSVISLIEGHGANGAELVGSLLLAYGYARAPRVATGEEQAVEADLEHAEDGGIAQ